MGPAPPGNLTPLSDKGIHITQLAIAWVVAQESTDCAIVGARSKDPIETSLDAADVELSDDEHVASPEGVA